MEKESKQFLHDLLLTPSPTGHEELIQDVVRSRMKRYADIIETDLHGNVIVGVNTKAKRRIMIAGHCDQIGFMVKHISKDGFVYFAALGGIDASVTLGAHVTIYGKKGPVTGIFGRKPIHAQNAEERAKVSIDLDKFWVDIGAKDQREAEKRIAVGDYATYKLGVTYLNDDLIVSPGLDDKSGLFVTMEAARLCAKAKLNVAFYGVSTVQEEVGLRGAKTAAYGIDPEVGIGVDVTHASDTPATEGSKVSPCKLGKGPMIIVGPGTNPVVDDLLVRCAKKSKIGYQMGPTSGMLGNDTNAIQVSKKGVATSSIAIPNRYMHTQVEVCSLADLEASARLIAAFAQEIKANTDFRPGFGGRRASRL